MAARQAGSEVLVRYNVRGPVEWHVRLLGCQLDVDGWIICTPDFDIYFEDFASDDFQAVRDFAAGRQAPPGVRAGDIYDFANALQGPALAAILAECDAEGRRHAQRHRLPFPYVPPVLPGGGGPGGALVPGGGPPAPALPGPAAPAVPIAPAAPAPAVGLAALGGAPGLPAPGGPAPAAGGGLAVPAPAGAAAAAGVAAPTDARVLTVKYNSQGIRYREFRDAVDSISVVVWPDWPLRGPVTVVWVLKFMLENGGSPTQWHLKWRMLAKLTATDGGVSSHELCCQILENMVCYDQLDAGALVSAENAARHIQLQEDRWQERVLGQATNASADALLFAGTTNRNLCICPLLSDWIAEENRKSNLVAKERRKAREERELQKPEKRG